MQRAVSSTWRATIFRSLRWPASARLPRPRRQLERLYDGIDAREADLEQLEQISGRYPTRERFLTELTLDPPSAAGDRAGDPLLDEDYLVLSTVHSAKGQEWEAVFVLNVTDGNFPSEFATGKPEMIEEERRGDHLCPAARHERRGARYDGENFRGAARSGSRQVWRASRKAHRCGRADARDVVIPNKKKR